MRTGFSVALVVVGLAGCLFPSFDDLNGTGKATGDVDKPNASSSSGAADASSGMTTTSSSSSGSALHDSGMMTTATDSGIDAAKPPVFEKKIHCDSQTCTPGAQVCCGPVVGGDSDCISPAQTLGHPCGNILLFCDGTEECGANEVCCFVNGESHCAATCAGMTLCDPAAAPCPAGTTCKGAFGVPGVKTCLQ